MDKEKKKWQTPKLICLYRGRPEEAVLQACKSNKSPGPYAEKCNPPKGWCSTRSDT